MDDEHEEQHESDEKFVQIVNASLADVDVRPTRMKVLDWVLVLSIIISLGLLVGALLGFCVWVWSVVLGKF